MGTTDEDYQGDPRQASISDAEVNYLLEVVNHHFKTQISENDIVHTYSGVRPLLEEKNATAQELSRDYKVEVSGSAQAPVLLNIFGGKITTYRKLAEHAVDQLCEFFPKAQPAWTKTAKLPGGDFGNKDDLQANLQSKYTWLDGKTITRFVRQYGTLCLHFLEGKTQLAELGEHFGAGLYQAEVDYLITEEWACTIEDILWRRTKLGLRLNQAEVQALEHYLTTPKETQLSA